MQSVRVEPVVSPAESFLADRKENRREIVLAANHLPLDFRRQSEYWAIMSMFINRPRSLRRLILLPSVETRGSWA